MGKNDLTKTITFGGRTFAIEVVPANVQGLATIRIKETFAGQNLNGSELLDRAEKLIREGVQSTKQPKTTVRQVRVIPNSGF